MEKKIYDLSPLPGTQQAILGFIWGDSNKVYQCVKRMIKECPRTHTTKLKDVSSFVV
jgi:hypothetical protein